MLVMTSFAVFLNVPVTLIFWRMEYLAYQGNIEANYTCLTQAQTLML